MKRSIDQFERAFREYPKYLYAAFVQLAACLVIELSVLFFYIKSRDHTGLVMLVFFAIITYLLFKHFKDEKTSDKIGSPAHLFLLHFFGQEYAPRFAVFMLDRNSATITASGKLYTIDRKRRTVCDEETKEYYSFNDFYEMVTRQSLQQ